MDELHSPAWHALTDQQHPHASAWNLEGNVRAIPAHVCWLAIGCGLGCAVLTVTTACREGT